MELVRTALSSWRARGGLLVALLAALACFASPLTDHLGYANALVAAVVSSLVGSFVAAGLPALFRRKQLQPHGGDVVALALGYGLVLALLFALTALVHGALTNPCTPGRGALYFALVALPGALLAPLAGLVVGALVPRPRLASLLAALVVPASIAGSLVRFYATPDIFAYDPFFGFFPGAIYDEAVPLGATLVTYRLGTFGLLLALGGLFAWLWDPASARLRWGARSGRGASVFAAAGGALLALAVYLAGPLLGHRESAEDIARALGGRIEGRRCTVVYARAIPGRQARLLQEDCELRIAQTEAFFGVHYAPRLTVFLFADAAQKQALMGAADTYIAKPWRNEVYLQYAPFPHPVLKHEIAHVVAGAMAPGPFHVTARARLLPLPGLIEGAAVAAAWEGEGDTSPHQWSRAMLEAGLAPSVRVLTGLGFYAHAAGTAYTAAGSFSRWLVERYGAARFRRVYADGDFASAYGKPLEALEREWHAFLRTVPAPDRILSRARVRFQRAALVSRVCPFETAELFEQASVRLAAGELGTARDELARVVANDPTEVAARVALAEAWARLGNVPRALALVREASRDLGPAAGARLRARVGDVVWRWRGADAARELYADVDPGLFDEDEARTIEVKRWALGLAGQEVDPAYTQALQDMLIGRGDTEPDGVAAVARLLGSERLRLPNGAPQAMSAYLVARQLEGHERYAEAAELLATIDPSQLPSDRLRAETRRLRGVALYQAGLRDAALAEFEALANDPSRPQGARDTAADWVDRIRREPR